MSLLVSVLLLFCFIKIIGGFFRDKNFTIQIEVKAVADVDSKSSRLPRI